MPVSSQPPLAGRCTCGRVRYRVTRPPLIVHCCHCQRKSGVSFALNCVVETDAVELLAGAPEEVDTPSASGRGQLVARCPSCRVALWSHYPQAGRLCAFVRAGTLEDPDAVRPDVHIYTSTKQPWVVLPAGARAVAEFYDVGEVWSAESFERWGALMEKGEAGQ
ncbi:Mss4-like protein [Hyaloraphidium curvatum]|nr:Mss4-like protein [Hyaloraphidium curvatum]KAI9034191.1 Mss4-like protein [Hyaloraphidium curvatum]